MLLHHIIGDESPLLFSSVSLDSPKVVYCFVSLALLYYDRHSSSFIDS